VTMKSLRWLALALLVALLPVSATAQENEDCERVPLTQKAVRLIGIFTAERPERFYCVFAQRGQHMKITIIPQTPDLNTQGNVHFPHGDLEPGGPGGVIFNEQLPDDGLYRIRIAQRFGEKKAGQFELMIELE
jgi:hypothetical protein